MPHHRRAQKSDDTRPARPAAKPKRTAADGPVPTAAKPPVLADPQAASPDQLLQLHKQVGNRALTRRIAALKASPVQRRPAEAPEVGLAGGEAPQQIEARLAASHGGGMPLPKSTRARMENGIGADFSGVRVHTGPESQSLNQRLGAQAFTHGADIYMGAGKYSPSSSDGQRLLAHELAHVVQQGASPVRRAVQPPDPTAEVDDEGIIRRKLAGTGAAIIQMGGSPSIKSKAKARLTALTSKIKGSTADEGSGKYAAIVSGLEKYEALEAKLLNQKPQHLDNKQKGELFGQLKELELLAASWLDQNKDAAQDEEVLGDQVNQKEVADIINEENVDQHRYHALMMLLPRLRHEQTEVAGDRFFRTMAFSDKTLEASKSKDDAFGGQVNRLDQVTHGGNQGVFIADQAISQVKTVGTGMGITLADSNAGARSVAMYQLAKLLDLGVDVIAKTDFATHTSATNKKGQPLDQPVAKLGVRMEMAQGTEAAQLDLAMGNSEARSRGGDTVSLEDPQLQRSLNAIQLIDAIAGQLDRHWHNYYVATDGRGKVTGVVGIDLDMSFAPNHKTVEPAPEDRSNPLAGAHYVGMPKLVDSAFAHRIVTVQADQVKVLLQQYLKPAEVTATVERFNLVKDACQKLINNRQFIRPADWGVQTAEAQLNDPNTNYLSKMASGTTKHDFADKALDDTEIKIGPTGDRRTVRALIGKLEKQVWAKALTAVESNALVQVLFANYLAKPENERRPLLDSLVNNVIAAWNTYLTAPAADSTVLAKTV